MWLRCGSEYWWGLYIPHVPPTDGGIDTLTPFTSFLTIALFYPNSIARFCFTMCFISSLSRWVSIPHSQGAALISIKRKASKSEIFYNIGSIQFFAIMHTFRDFCSQKQFKIKKKSLLIPRPFEGIQKYYGEMVYSIAFSLRIYCYEIENV